MNDEQDKAAEWLRWALVVLPVFALGLYVVRRGQEGPVSVGGWTTAIACFSGGQALMLYADKHERQRPARQSSLTLVGLFATIVGGLMTLILLAD